MTVLCVVFILCNIDSFCHSLNVDVSPSVFSLVPELTLPSLVIWPCPEQGYNSATGHFVRLVLQSPGTVSNWTFVRKLHYQPSKTCSRHICSLVPTSLTNCFQSTSSGGDWKRETRHRETGQRGTISQGWTLQDLLQCSSRCSLRVYVWFREYYMSCSSVLCLFLILSVFSYCYVRQTKLVSSLDNVWAHCKIVIDCVIDW